MVPPDVGVMLVVPAPALTLRLRRGADVHRDPPRMRAGRAAAPNIATRVAPDPVGHGPVQMLIADVSPNVVVEVGGSVASELAVVIHRVPDVIVGSLPNERSRSRCVRAWLPEDVGDLRVRS